jgi:hypothetical protein
MSDRSDPPEDLDGIDRALRGIRFRPRDAFAAELAGRAARSEIPHRRTGRPAYGLMATAAAAIAGLAWAGWITEVAAVDRCCYDLDGGVDADDGVLVLARRNQDVRRVAVYEDRDGSRSFTGGDLLRFSRGAKPTVLDPAAAGMVTIRHCCLDFDGGGPEDDGLLVMGVPPDRVMMVALYEESPSRGRSGYPLR